MLCTQLSFMHIQLRGHGVAFVPPSYVVSLLCYVLLLIGLTGSGRLAVSSFFPRGRHLALCMRLRLWSLRPPLKAVAPASWAYKTQARGTGSCYRSSDSDRTLASKVERWQHCWFPNLTSGSRYHEAIKSASWRVRTAAARW